MSILKACVKEEFVGVIFPIYASSHRYGSHNRFIQLDLYLNGYCLTCHNQGLEGELEGLALLFIQFDCLQIFSLQEWTFSKCNFRVLRKLDKFSTHMIINLPHQ